MDNNFNKNDNYYNGNNTTNNKVQQSVPNNYYTYNSQYNSYNYINEVSSPNNGKARYGKIILSLIIIVLILVPIVILLTQKFAEIEDNANKKNRTFMIYMVGSDLESKSSQGTYSISEIVPANIDLRNNNIVLMVGGAKKWHNFVNPDEVAIYELTSNGFSKVKNDIELNMGEKNTLTEFLDYSYNNYPAKKYDLIFWNHGMGAFGLEHDEVAEDFININELDNAFKDSKFKNQKLELAIFYNCLTENIHIANVMSKYSEYMLGSEEIIYLSKLFNRLKFFERVKVNDTAVDIAKYFISISDAAIDNYNDTHIKGINSTLSLIDLSKIDKLNNNLDKFIATVDVSDNYYDIAAIRRRLYTYGKNQNNDYDTIDLYALVEALGKYSSNNTALNDLKNSINDAVVINSSEDGYSYGISVYFPYYSGYEVINAHLIMFKKMWNNSSYVSFIKDFNDIRYNNYRNTRTITGKNTNELSNDITIKGNSIELKLDDKEKEKYQNANIYIFKKDSDNDYELLLKSNKLTNNKGTIKFNYNGLLKVNDEYISYYDLDDSIVYGNLSNNEEDLNVLFTIHFDENLGKIVETILDSGSNPLSSIIELDDYNKITLSKIKYNYFDQESISEEWKNNYKRENIEYSKDKLDIRLEKDTLRDCYIMIEMVDLDNDSYYSKMLYVE